MLCRQLDLDFDKPEENKVPDELMVRGIIFNVKIQTCFHRVRHH